MSSSGPLGPVFLYDLVRCSRRGEQTVHRILYAVLLAGILLWSYWSWFPNFDLFDPLRSLVLPNPAACAQFAASFSARILGLQLLIVILLTPMYTAGAISDEKERRSLEFLLITDLRDREIVLGMLAARLARLLLLVLTGLPALSLLPLLGGVEPRTILAGYFATVAITLGLGSISILLSVIAKTSLKAVVGAYGLLPLFLIVSLCPYPAPIVNPFWAAVLPLSTVDPTKGEPLYWPGLLIFGLVQGLITVICCGLAVSSLREHAGAGRAPRAAPRERRQRETNGWGPYPEREEPYPRYHHRAPADPFAKPRPPVGDAPLLWKEMYVEKYLGSPEWQLSREYLLVAAIILAAVVGVGWYMNRLENDSLGALVQPLVRTLGTMVGGLALIGVAVSASSRISREQERRTLDSLLALPVSRWDILLHKWWGSVLSVRGLWLALAAIWCLGCAAGAVDVFALPLLTAGWFVCAGFLAAVGLWFSSICRITLRATLLTFLASLLFVVNPFGLLSSAYSVSPNTEVIWWDAFLEHLTSPGRTLGTFTFRTADLTGPLAAPAAWTHILAAVAALYVYLAAIPLLWLLTLLRLRPETSPSSRKKAA